MKLTTGIIVSQVDPFIDPGFEAIIPHLEVNGSIEEDTDETPYGWDCDRDYPEEAEEEEDE